MAVDDAAKMASDLEEMAAEDDRHQKPSKNEFDLLSPEAQSREWAFRLRDAPAPEGFSDYTFWTAKKRAEESAIEQLVGLGLPAVTVLLEMLNDQRPTRAVYVQTRFHKRAFATEMRSLALNALSEIAGVNFTWLLKSRERPLGAEGWAEVREIASGWWASVRDGTEAQWLDSKNSVTEFKAVLGALARRFPARYREEILKVDPSAREEYLRGLWTIKTSETDAFLREELAHDPVLANRIAVAYPLRERGESQATRTMLENWRALDGAVAPAKGADESEQPFAPRRLLAYLLSSGDEEAHRAVMERWKLFTPSTRAFVIDRWDLLLSQEKADRETSADDEDDPVEVASGETRALLRDYLMKALSDNSVLPDREMHKVKNLTVAEVAAENLAKAWRVQFHFKFQADPKKRAAALAGIRNEAAAATQGLMPK